MKSSAIKFNNSNGESLSARLDLPMDQHPVAYAIFAHCFTCSKNLSAVKHVSEALTREGIAVLRFDFTGLGSSEGAFEDSNFTTNVQDIGSAAMYLAENYEAPTLFVGHSLGGAAILNAAASIPSVKAVATIGAPATPEHVQHLFQEDIETIHRDGQATVNIGGRPFTIKKQLVDDLTAKSIDEEIHELNKALLIIHSPQDNIVGIENAKKIYDAAMHPKSFVSLDGADHLMSKDADAKYVGQLIGSWSKRYLDQDKETLLKTDGQVVTRTTIDSFLTDIRAGNHNLIADEPEDANGTDFGPSPYDLLLSALGACTSMTLYYYANLKKWKLDEARVHLTHNKTHASDCENCETDGSAKIDVITREVELEGDLTTEQRERLLEIANKCPVHKTLHGEIKVETSLR